MRAVITVIGRDVVGILSRVSTSCAEEGINIIEVTQSVLQDMFAMIMLCDISGSNIEFSEFVKKMEALGAEQNLSIHAMHEDIFGAMHRV